MLISYLVSSVFVNYKFVDHYVLSALISKINLYAHSHWQDADPAILPEYF